MIAMASLSRSHHHNKIAKLLTVYFKSNGLATKAFDTLHALGLTMSQKWAYSGIETLSDRVRLTLLDDLQKYPWFGAHDNLNMPFRVYEQRLDNQSHFDSGTAATVFIIKDPAAVCPDNAAIQAQIALGAKNPITLMDIIQLEWDAAPRIHTQAIFHVLNILTGAAAFDFETYEHRDDALLSPPPPVCQLPVGPEYTTCQYMLDTVHMEEASYDGNARVLKEWWRQLKFDIPAAIKQLCKKAIVWVGDQLTVSRIRGLQRFRSQDPNPYQRLEFVRSIFGWFHAQIAFESSLHDQYYGTELGFGLVQAFDLLKRKGLHAPSIKGNFHHDIKEALDHVAQARFRDLWCCVGGVEKLEDLRSRQPQELHDLASEIVRQFASTEALQDLATQEENVDELLYQSVQMARDLLVYLELDAAIKIGDVGRIQDILPRLLFRFVGGKNKNYAIEILELLQALHRERPTEFKFAFCFSFLNSFTSALNLREYVLKYCWLANTTGREGGFLPIDLLQEHNVRDIKVPFFIKAIVMNVNMN
jgi:hypothetical protein